MSAAFAGAARLAHDDVAKHAVLRGAGRDSLGKSRAQGDMTSAEGIDDARASCTKHESPSDHYHE